MNGYEPIVGLNPIVETGIAIGYLFH